MKEKATRGFSKEKVFYATAISQDYTFCGGPAKMGNISTSTLSKQLLKNLAPDVVFIGDSSKANKQFVKEYNIKSELVISSKDSRIGEYNLQKINYFHSEIKKRMDCNQCFSTKHSEKLLAIKSMMRMKSKVDIWK